MTEPAVYSLMPRDGYDAIKANNSSLLKVLASRTAAHAWNTFLNPASPKQKDPKHLRLGIYAHVRLLETPLWETARVTGLGATTKAYAEEAKKAEKDGVLLIQEDEYDLINAMAASVLKHPVLAPYFEPTEANLALNELTLTWNDQTTGQPCKARLDAVRISDEGEILCLDLKTTVDASPIEFGKSAANYLYTLQGAFYADGLYYCAKPLEALLSLPEGTLQGRPVTFEFVAIEKEAPHLVARYRLTAEQAAMGRDLYREALRVISEASESGQWAGYSNDPQPLQIPGWAVTQHENLLAAIK